MAKKMLGAKVAPRTLERLEKYADKEGISKSEATDRLVKKGLDVSESDNMMIVKSDGGTNLQDVQGTADQALANTDQLLSRLDQVEKDSDRTITDKLVLITIMWVGIGIAAGTPTWFPEVTYLLYIGLILVYLLYTIGGESW
jgi:threonyl-tRNA synthetase